MNFLVLRDRGSQPAARDMRKILADEERLATRLLEICESDSHVGFEASLKYVYLPLDIREKIAACRYAGGGIDE